MDADIWGVVLLQLSFRDQCAARATERAARDAYVSIDDFVVKWRTTNNGGSFARAVRQHVLKPSSGLLSLVLHHVPLGADGALQLSRGSFDSLQVLDITNCKVPDAAAATLVRKSKDVPVLVLDRNQLEDDAFAAVMHKLFHLSDVPGEEYVVSLRNMKTISSHSIRMLTWGAMQIVTSRLEIHCTPLNKTNTFVFKQAACAHRKMFDEHKAPLRQVDVNLSVFADLPRCTNLKIRVPVAAAAAPPPPLAPPVAPPVAPPPTAPSSVTPVAPPPTAPSSVTPPAPPGSRSAAMLGLPQDRNARRRLPLPVDVMCRACGFVWEKGSITISQCETFRSQCKVHNRLCSSRMSALAPRA